MNTYDIWRRGIPLETAWFEFAPQEKRCEYLSLRETCSTGAVFQRVLVDMQKYMDEGIGWQKAIIDFPENERSELERYSDLIQELRTQTHQWILDDKLLAFGFEKPRNADDKPVRVPADIWARQVNWESSEVSAGSLVIELVRLVHPSAVLPQIAATPGAKQKRGRPSRKTEIVEAYEVLRGKGKIDFTKSLRENSEAIRNQVILANPAHSLGTRGLGREVIRVTLRDRFEKDKELDSDQKL